MRNNVTGCFFLYAIKLNISTRKGIEFYKWSYYYFNWSFQCNEQTMDQISFHKHFKLESFSKLYYWIYIEFICIISSLWSDHDW